MSAAFLDTALLRGRHLLKGGVGGGGGGLLSLICDLHISGVVIIRGWLSFERRLLEKTRYCFLIIQRVDTSF